MLAQQQPAVIKEGAVPLGSGDCVSMLILDGIEEIGGEDRDDGFRVVANPEFLREGAAAYDSLLPKSIAV